MEIALPELPVQRVDARFVESTAEAQLAERKVKKEGQCKTRLFWNRLSAWYPNVQVERTEVQRTGAEEEEFVEECLYSESLERKRSASQTTMTMTISITATTTFSQLLHQHRQAGSAIQSCGHSQRIMQGVLH